MQYSAVVIALFAAKALAAPALSNQQVQESALDVVDGATSDYPEVTTDYPETTTEETYPTEEETYPTEEETYPTEENTEYPTEEVSYENEVVEEPCYTKGDNTKYGKPVYFEQDESAYKTYEETNPLKKWNYKSQFNAGEKCDISYEYKDGYKAPEDHGRVQLCNSSDGYEKCEDICKGYECKDYTLPEDCVPSDDSKKGYMHRFKYCEGDDDKVYSYSKEFAVYNPGYYEKNKDCSPEPTRCPPPKVAIKAPVYPVTPAAPVTPVEKPVEQPAAPVAPVAYPSNDTATVPAVQPYDSGSSAVRASLSAIVGFAAVVAFAL